MIRDEEIKRLIRYAQGMGVAVRFKPYVRGGNEAESSLDGTEIIIYEASRTSKLDKVLSLIHEIAHVKGFIDNDRAVDPKIEEAIDSDENKRHRKRVLDMETMDSNYWVDIYRDTNCQFGLDRLEMQRNYDLWQYEVYYETGDFPSNNEKTRKRKELRKKYLK